MRIFLRLTFIGLAVFSFGYLNAMDTLSSISQIINRATPAVEERIYLNLGPRSGIFEYSTEDNGTDGGLYFKCKDAKGSWKRIWDGVNLNLAWYPKSSRKNLKTIIDPILATRSELTILFPKTKEKFISDRIQFIGKKIKIVGNGCLLELNSRGNVSGILFQFIDCHSVQIESLKLGGAKYKPTNKKHGLITISKTSSSEESLVSIRRCTFSNLINMGIYLGNYDYIKNRTAFGVGYSQVIVDSNYFSDNGKFGAVYLRGAHKTVYVTSNTFVDSTYKATQKTLSISSEVNVAADHSKRAIVAHNSFRHQKHSNIFVQACGDVEISQNSGEYIGHPSSLDHGVFIKIDDLNGKAVIKSNRCSKFLSPSGNALMVQGDSKDLEIMDNEFGYRVQLRGNGGVRFVRNVLEVSPINEGNIDYPSAMLNMVGRYNNGNIIESNTFRYKNYSFFDKTPPNVMEISSDSNLIANNEIIGFNRVGIRLNKGTEKNILFKNIFDHISLKSQYAPIYLSEIKSASILSNESTGDSPQSIYIVNREWIPQALLCSNKGFRRVTTQLFDDDKSCIVGNSTVDSKGAIDNHIDQVTSGRYIKKERKPMISSQAMWYLLNNSRKKKVKAMRGGFENQYLIIVGDGVTKLKSTRQLNLANGKTRTPQRWEPILFRKEAGKWVEICY